MGHKVHDMNSLNLCNHVLCDCHCTTFEPPLEDIHQVEIMKELEDKLDDREENSDDEGKSADEPEVRELSELEIFSQMLRNAQEAAKAAKCKTQSNQPKRYFGNTVRSKQRHRKFAKDMAGKGFLSVQDFLKRKAESLPVISIKAKSSLSPVDTVTSAPVLTSPVPEAQMDTDAPLMLVQAEHMSKNDGACKKVEQMLKDL
ncbi:hypothetical protein ARMGADRAFT_1027595 [Armillaria gallica]|uniref:Uncharacterized protein n=1 Tax=Armillaria gallica TaxID=47427 RepID=A0A2H3DMV4_ARMGA|nr:hypothetical protein ARMGADRAFT_1027595 [Armillaria gallica]